MPWFAGPFVVSYLAFMVTVRLFFPIVILAMAGCAPDPAARQKVTGNDAAVAGWPRQSADGRFLISNCCTFRLASNVKPIPGQGVDAVVQNVSGPGYMLRIVFGPYNGGEPATGYELTNKRIIDGVELNAFRWADRTRAPPEGRLLWIGLVGGGIIHGVEHAPWGLRVSADCTVPAACDASAALVRTIRF